MVYKILDLLAKSGNGLLKLQINTLKLVKLAISIAIVS